MKQSNLSFADGFLGLEAKTAKEKGNTHKAFDWDKAAELIVTGKQIGRAHV